MPRYSGIKSCFISIALFATITHASAKEPIINVPAATAALGPNTTVMCFGFLSALAIVQIENKDDPNYSTDEMKKFQKNVQTVTAQYTYLMNYTRGQSDIEPSKAMAEGFSTLKTDRNQFLKVIGECTKKLTPFKKQPN